MERKIDLAFSIAGVSYRDYSNILESNILQSENYNKLSEYINLEKTKKVIDEIKNVEDKLRILEDLGISYITFRDEKFPKILLDIEAPCYVLYYRGNIDLINKFSIGMIGSRKPTTYGKFVATKFSSELSKKGVVIISGFAAGIDTICHKGATENKNNTIAVLGTSIDNIYPKLNLSYAEEILKSGNLIISEFFPKTRTMPYHFVQRNRIISALSSGLVVVEASEKSGTLTTVDFALEQGKNVFAIPGNINSLNSLGTNKLIKTGAKMVTEVDDIIEEYDNIEFMQNDNSISIDLSTQEMEIYNLLKEKGNLTNEEISIFTKKDIKYIIGILNVLEIKEIVKDIGNNTYILQ